MILSKLFDNNQTSIVIEERRRRLKKNDLIKHWYLNFKQAALSRATAISNSYRDDLQKTLNVYTCIYTI